MCGLFYKLFGDKILDVIIGKHLKTKESYKFLFDILYKGQINDHPDKNILKNNLNFMKDMVLIKKVSSTLEKDWDDIILNGIATSFSMFESVQIYDEISVLLLNKL